MTVRSPYGRLKGGRISRLYAINLQILPADYFASRRQKKFSIEGAGRWSSLVLCPRDDTCKEKTFTSPTIFFLLLFNSPLFWRGAGGEVFSVLKLPFFLREAGGEGDLQNRLLVICKFF